MVQPGCVIRSVTWLRRVWLTKSKPRSRSSSFLLKNLPKPWRTTLQWNHSSLKQYRVSEETYKSLRLGWKQSAAMSTSWYATRYKRVLADQATHSGHGKNQASSLISSPAVNQLPTGIQWAHVFSKSSLSVSYPVPTSTLSGAIQQPALSLTQSSHSFKSAVWLKTVELWGHSWNTNCKKCPITSQKSPVVDCT